jgi:hypothetical protein
VSVWQWVHCRPSAPWTDALNLPASTPIDLPVDPFACMSLWHIRQVSLGDACAAAGPAAASAIAAASAQIQTFDDCMRRSGLVFVGPSPNQLPLGRTAHRAGPCAPRDAFSGTAAHACMRPAPAD